MSNKESLLTSFIARVSSGPNYAKWTSSFSKLVERCGNSSPDKIGALLPQLEDWLTPVKFENSTVAAQADLLLLWDLLLKYVNERHIELAHKESAFALIASIMQRDDFSLTEQVSEEIRRSYNKLLLATFDKASHLLSVNTKVVGEIQFASQVLAIFFFRLPLVSTMVVDALQTKSKEVKNEQGFWVANKNEKRRGSRFGKLSQDMKADSELSEMQKSTEEWTEQDKQFVDSNPDLFLWNSSLNDSTLTSAVFAHVSEVSVHWARWLSTKESFFLSFLELFVLHIQRTSKTREEIRWKIIPGYELLLSCFFPLLRSAIWWDSIARRTAGQGSGWVTSLQGYMRVKKTATCLLVADTMLLPAYFNTTFECTNLHSLLSVDSGIEHLNLFLAVSAVFRKPKLDAFTAAPRGISTTSAAKGDSLPDSFNYDHFWHSFSLMLDSESYQVLLKCCSFLYNNLHLFYGRSRTRIVNDLLGPKLFYRLFLHWSPEVRTCFHHLVVYKVLRADRRYLPCFSDSQVMLLYGTTKKKTPVSPPRLAVSAKAAWGKQDDQPSSDAPATADEIAQLTRSAQRRLALFDRANAVDDEELWSDMAFSSKIDSFVRMCLTFRENAEDGPGVPKNLFIYVEPALEQYSLLLIRYYRGATLASLDDIPDTLSHRMMLSEFTES